MPQGVWCPSYERKLCEESNRWHACCGDGRMQQTKSPKLFVNLPIKQLDRTVTFFTQLGFKFDAKFTDESSTCMIVNGEAYCMLMVENRFTDFVKKPVADATKGTEVILALGADSRAAVDELVDKALGAGATAALKPMDLGFMYGRSFYDLDGHHWEVFYMDPNADPMKAQP